MIEVNGKYSNAKIYTNNIEETALAQINELCNQPFVEGSQIRIMPDVHAGASCVIGTTMTIKDKVVPNLVGVDIGCGMLTVNLGKVDLDLPKIDSVIKNRIPAGFEARDEIHQVACYFDFKNLKSINVINESRAALSLGSLGGGNHFIECSIDDEGDTYLIIHTGSRHLGKQVAEYYQNLACNNLGNNRKNIAELVQRLKIEGRERDIERELKALVPTKVNKEFAWLEGKTLDDYLHDMNIVQKYARVNREIIAVEILEGMSLSPKYSFATVHNYIDLETKILRKGAVSAKRGEKLLIPLNMRDGSLICIGKGNEDWNCSAPHGAGRLFSRGTAKMLFDLEEYQKTMEGIYTTSVNPSTIDESPMAYKNMQEIMDNIGDTVEVVSHLKPIYNFKSS